MTCVAGSCKVHPVRTALVLAVLPCCHGTPAVRAPAEQRDFSATLNGDRVRFASALTRARANGRVEVIVSTRDRTCADVDERVAPNEVRFSLTLVPKLLPDGRRSWRIEERNFEDVSGGSNDGEALEGTIDTNVGARSRIGVTSSGALTMEAFEGSRKLIVRGSLDAVGCGVDKNFEWQRPSPQPAMLEVAGNSFPIAGAAIVPATSDSGLRLMLGTESVDCGVSGDLVLMTSVGDVTLELEMLPNGSLLADLEGDLIGERGGTYRNATTGLTIESSPLQREPAVVEVDLGGHAVISRRDGGPGFAISLRGKVRATLCARPAVK